MTFECDGPGYPQGHPRATAIPRHSRSAGRALRSARLHRREVRRIGGLGGTARGHPPSGARAFERGPPWGSAPPDDMRGNISEMRYSMHWTVTVIPEAEAELLALPADMQARFLHIAELLESFGPQKVGMPHIRPLEGKLWEMRMTGRDGIARAVYVARTGQRLTVLHVFTKKTQKTPRKAIETAQARLRSLTND